MHGRGFSVLIALICSYGANAQSESPEKILEQAVRWHQAGDIDRAIPAYEKFLAQRPDFLMALSNLGAAYARVGRYQDAIAQYHHALNLDPANTQVQLNLALAYYKTAQTEAAATILEKVHQAVPDQLQPALLLANCWLAMGKEQRRHRFADTYGGTFAEAIWRSRIFWERRWCGTISLRAGRS
jgi:tetratricopeptide (TPR) repeat protein